MLIFLTSAPSLFAEEELWEWAIENITARLIRPNVKMETALELYGDDDSLWSEVWNDLLPDISLLIFFADDSNWIDATVYVEITESLKAKKHVYFLNKKGVIKSCREFKFRVHRNSLRFAQIVENVQ